MSQSPEAVVREWFEQLWNQKKVDTIDGVFAADGIAHGLSDDPGGERPRLAADARSAFLAMPRGGGEISN